MQKDIDLFTLFYSIVYIYIYIFPVLYTTFLSCTNMLYMFVFFNRKRITSLYESNHTALSNRFFEDFYDVRL